MVEYAGGISLRPGKGTAASDLREFILLLEREPLPEWEATYHGGPFARFECTKQSKIAIELIQTGSEISDNRLVLKSGAFDLLATHAGPQVLKEARALYIRLFESLSPDIAVVPSGACHPAKAPEPVEQQEDAPGASAIPDPCTAGIRGLLKRLPRLGFAAYAG